MLTKILFFIAMQLSPFYLFQSGQIQPAQMIFIFFIGVFLLKYKKIKILKLYIKPIIPLILLLTYISLVQGFYFIQTNDISFLKNFIFYFYNFFIFCFILYVFSRDKNYIKLLYYSSITTIIFLGGLYFIFFTGSLSRTSMFFNNPNQLAYYVLLNISIIMHVYYNVNIRIPKLLFGTTIVFSILLMLASISKAGFVSLIILFLIFSFKNKKVFFMILFLALTMSILFIVYSEDLELIQLVIDRITNKAGRHSDGILIERGYIRIFQYPEFLFFGAGEGMYHRFNAILEIHSLLGNIIFSYGLIGFILFLYFIVNLFKLTSGKLIIMIMPLLFYGIVHNSIRNPLFWIYCALLFVTLKENKNET